MIRDDHSKFPADVAHEDSLDTFYSSLDRNHIPEGDDKALTRI